MNTSVMTTKIEKDSKSENNEIPVWVKFVTKKSKDVLRAVVAPAVAFLIFLLIWNAGAAQIHTSLGQVPALEPGGLFRLCHHAPPGDSGSFYLR